MTKTRPIKFRAWDKIFKKITHNIFMSLEKDELLNILNMFHILNERYEFMQFTGCYDENGKEIFERDVLFNAYYEENGKVVFEEGCFVVKYKTWQHELFEGYADCVIVGNIYENPELLKECENE